MGKKKKAAAQALREQEQHENYLKFIDLLDQLNYEAGEVNNMGISVSRLAQVASLVAFGAAALGHALFGYDGLELVSAGLFLHVGADVIEDVVAG